MGKRNNPETSIEAYRSLDVRELNETYRQILMAMDALGECTFEEVAAWMKCSPAKVWRRMSELNKMELVYRPGNKRMLKSGRMGFTWMRTNPSKTSDQQKELSYRKDEMTAADHAIELIKSCQQITLF